MKRDKVKSQSNQPPKELLILIDIVNLLPWSLEISNPRKLFQKRFLEIAGMNYEEEDFNDADRTIFSWDAEKWVLERVGEETADYPDFLYRLKVLFDWLNYPHGLPREDLDRFGNFNDCVKFYFLRKQLSQVAKAGKTVIFDENFTGELPAIRTLKWFCTDEAFGHVILASAGRISAPHNFVATLLDDLEYEKLRFCPICSQMFWAHRKDKFGCSEKCSQNIRARRTREKRDKMQSLSRVVHEQ